jgi:N,N'-diacetyl-8-epilegionaminate cytidylyltransferase
MSSDVVACIFARGGSKGVPRKNLRLLAGKPLVAHAIETARSSSLVGRVIVSTDDMEIAEVSKRHGAEVPFIRPAELATDRAPEWLAWKHAIHCLTHGRQENEISILVSVPPTSPLRSVQDIDACIRTLQATDADVVITVKNAARNPYYNMVTLDDSGNARIVMKAPGALHGRQDAPVVYDVTTVAYAARSDYVVRSQSMFEGRVKAVVVPEERALDIDSELDMKFAEFMMDQRL